MNKLIVDFVTHNDPITNDVANAQLIQLMTTITKIGLRVDYSKSDDIIVKEISHDSETKE